MNTSEDQMNTMDLELEAMLYVVRDPAIDCEAFEKRMAEDSIVADAVSHAVALVCNVRELETNALAESEPIRTSQASSLPALAEAIRMPKISFDPAWAFLVTISAAVSVFLLRANFSTTDVVAEPMLQVAYAWTDIQSSKVGTTGELSALTTPGEDNIAYLESRGAETDLPDWMVLAAIASNSINTEMVQ